MKTSTFTYSLLFKTTTSRAVPEANFAKAVAWISSDFLSAFLMRIGCLFILCKDCLVVGQHLLEGMLMLRTVRVIKLCNSCRLWLCCLEHNPRASGTFWEVKVWTILFAEVCTQASVLSSGWWRYPGAKDGCTRRIHTC